MSLLYLRLAIQRPLLCRWRVPRQPAAVSRWEMPVALPSHRCQCLSPRTLRPHCTQLSTPRLFRNIQQLSGRVLIMQVL